MYEVTQLLESIMNDPVVVFTPGVAAYFAPRIIGFRMIPGVVIKAEGYQ